MIMKNMKFKFFPHTADIKFQSFGKNLEDAFEGSALALAEIMYKGKVKQVFKKKIAVKGKDREALLYNFLEEFLFLFDTEGFLLSKIEKLKIDRNKEYELKAEISGDKARNYKIDLTVKAITYNEMFVKKEKGRYVCQVVVDV